MRSALPLVTLACAVGLLLTGCIAEDPVVVPPTAEMVEPLFASDEEALAAATDAYEAYADVSDLISQEGGKNPGRLTPYVTEEWLAQELSGFEELAKSEQHLSGSGHTVASLLQYYDHDAVAAYFCVDVEDVRLMTADNVDVTPDTRSNKIAIEAHFRIEHETETLRLDWTGPWHGTEIC